MKKETRSQLNMERPRYYDGTDSDVIILQRVELDKLLKEKRDEGLMVGSWWGSLTLGSSTALQLSTAGNVNSLFGIDGPTWHAIFVLVILIAVIWFIVTSVSLTPKFFKKNICRTSEDIISRKKYKRIK
jgi:hypothetical protein